MKEQEPSLCTCRAGGAWGSRHVHLEDGRVLADDASGSWYYDPVTGEVDIAFFVSPSWMRRAGSESRIGVAAGPYDDLPAALGSVAAPTHTLARPTIRRAQARAPVWSNCDFGRGSQPVFSLESLSGG